MTTDLANLLASRFIARKDVKARQFGPSSGFPAGGYAPVTIKTGTPPVDEYVPWKREDLNAHLAGDSSFGHYLINSNDTCKLFAFDIDLEKSGVIPTAWDQELLTADPDHPIYLPTEYAECADLRAQWHIKKRSNLGVRAYMKLQFKMASLELASGIRRMLGVEVACAYSGNKGVHVYGLTGVVEALEAREAGLLVLEELGYQQARGVHFKKPGTDPYDDQPNLSVELFPKQSSLDGKDLGNLMRLPLGRNIKSTDPTFMYDFRGPTSQLTPIDSVAALTPGYNVFAA